MAEESKKLQSLFNKFCTRVENEISNTYLNGDRDTRYPGNINFSFAGVEGESLMGAISNIAVSSGSACTSDSLSPSYVLRAINIDPELAHTAIRFGIGRFTTEEEIDYVVDSLKVA
uniref:Aminotransferase class V domain-containing protein n=1 Tax=Biomphalaria glabrata TaxID=6526 RepID=A0A2C9M6B0_BIOGL